MKRRTKRIRRAITRSLLLAGVFAALFLINSTLPCPDAEAKSRDYLPEESVATPEVPPQPEDSEGSSPEDSHAPDLSPPPLGYDGVGEADATASVCIDAGNVRYPVNKANFGGKIMKELEVYSLYKNLEHLKKLTPGFWIWAHTAGPDSNYRWDTHEPLEGGYEITWPVFGVSGSGVMQAVEEPSAVGLDYWQATDIRHCACVRKVAGTAQAAMMIIFRDEEGNVIVRDDVHYIRFDFKVDDEVPFASPEDDMWCLVNTESGGWNSNYKVYLREDMRLEVVAYSTINGDPHAPTTLRVSNQFTRGEWHTLEVYYVTGSESGACAYYLDGVRQDIKTGLDTSSSAHTGTRKVTLGCVGGQDAEGTLYIDAFRAHDTYVGVEPGDPRDFICAVHFDSSATNVDDFLYYAEKAGSVPVVQTVLFPPDTGRDHLTPQFSADLVEYVNGEADPDYAVRARQLDFTHNTPSDNWANLRAARGRVEPYNVRYFTMGNEPYWAENWPKDNPALYAQASYQHALKMKEVDPSIKIGVFMYDGPNWDREVLTANKDVLDWLCIQHDYSYEQGVSLSNQVPRLLGISAATNVTSGKPWVRRHAAARDKLRQYLPDRDDYDEIITSQDEHGFCLIYGVGQGADLGYAIYRLGYRLETIEHGGPNAWDTDWLLINDRKFTYGVIGSDCLNPSYWAYRLFYEHFGAKYLSTTTSSPEYEIPNYKTGKVCHKAPCISAYASLSGNDSVLKIIVINRSLDKTIDVNFTLRNFTVSPGIARVYTLGGGGKGVFDTNLENPDNITIQESEMEIGGAEFTYTAEPLSMTAIEIDGFSAPTLSIRYLSDGNVELSWTRVPDGTSYVLQWGETQAYPFGGTEDYPGGQVCIRMGTRLFFRMSAGDSMYASVKALFADGAESPQSNVVHVNVMGAPPNVITQVIGSALIIRWEAVQDAAGYRISYGTTPQNLDEYTIDAGSSTMKVIYPQISGRLYLAVRAYDANGVTGPPSVVVPLDMP